MTTTAAGAPRIEVLDGLRGVAILLVLAHHATVMEPSTGFDRLVVSLASAGWCGVDLFFVLSGFLITGILLDSHGQPGWLRDFWRRRAARILPLYFTLLVVALFILPHVGHAKTESFARIRGDELAYWTFLQNFTIAEHGFRHGLLDVTWSLAIEMQFYLLWPFAVAWFGPTRIARACATIVVAGIAFRLWLVAHESFGAAAYVLTPGRLDGLMIGALIAAALRSGGWETAQRVARPMSWISAAGLAATWAVDSDAFAWTSWWSQTMGYTLWAIFFGSLLVRAMASPPESAWRRALSHPMLASLAKYSYGMYLFTVPVRAVVRDLAFVPEDLPGQVLFFAVCLGLTYSAAWVSWHAYERHFLRLSRTPARDVPARRFA